MYKIVSIVFVFVSLSLAFTPEFTNAGFINANGSPISLNTPTPGACDWDEDGKPDLLIGDFPGYLYYYHNTGTETSPDLEAGVKMKAGGQVIHLQGG